MFELTRGALHGGIRARKLGAEAVDFGLERTRVDLEEEVAFVDHRSFIEANGGDESGNARTDGDGVHGLEAGGEFVPLGDVVRDDFGDADLRWRRRSAGLRGDARAGLNERNEKHERESDQN